MPPSTPAPHRMTPLMVVVMLTLFMGIQPVTTDLYLPGLPTLQRELGGGVAGAQLTLSVLIICFGIGQLVCGPLADRFGRRPVLLAGAALYTLSALGGATAPSIEVLVGWRALQGAAMAAAVTCGRSVIRDLFVPAEGARVLSRALSGLGVIAMLSPVLGGLAVEALGWRAALVIPALFGAATLALVAMRFDETTPLRNPAATQPATVLANWRAVLANRTFRAWATLSAFTYGGLFFMLAGSSFIFIERLGTSRSAYGVMLGTMSIAYLAGTVLCRRLLPRFGLRGTVARGACFSLAGGLSMAALDLAGVASIWAILLPQYLFAIGHGIHQPCGQAGAVGPFPERAGTAASLSGFVMTAAALGVGLWVGDRLAPDTSLPVTLGIGAFSIALAAVAWTWVQRDGDPAASRQPAPRVA